MAEKPVPASTLEPSPLPSFWRRATVLVHDRKVNDPWVLRLAQMGIAAIHGLLFSAWKILRRNKIRGPEINVVGFFRQRMGLSVAARLLVKQLEALGYSVRCVQLDGGELVPGTYQDGTDQGGTTIIVANPDLLAYLAAHGLRRKFMRAEHLIGYWFWEQTVLPKTWAHHCQILDRIWVATHFNRTCFAQAMGENRTTYAPLAWPEQSGLRVAKNSELTVFVLYEQSSCFWRKRPDFAWEIYLRMLEMRSDPELPVRFVLLFNGRGVVLEEERTLFEAIRNHPFAQLVEGPLSDAGYQALIFSAHIVLATHTAEGLGLPLIEGVMGGLRVVATGWSGVVGDFPAPFDSLPYQLRRPEIRSYHALYRPWGEWAYVDVASSAVILNRVVDEIRAGQTSRSVDASIPHTIQAALTRACQSDLAVRNHETG